MIEKINLRERVNAVDGLFSYLRVGQRNGHMLNVLQAENGTLDFHVHASSDELFYCIEGEFDLAFDDGLIHQSKSTQTTKAARLPRSYRRAHQL